jgi:hypothetical protein
MTQEIRNLFYKVVNNSLSTQQINFLGESVDINFNLNTHSGFSESIPIPRQTAVQTLLDYFNDDEQFINLFTIMLAREGERFYDRDLAIWGRDEFIALLNKYKWIYDKETSRFLLDPFYEHEINFLKKIRVIDLRKKSSVTEIINQITEVSKKMGITDLEWRVTLRLYDLEPKIGELIRKIISLLLSRQNLQIFTPNIFACLKELAINASKANYKLLFAKYITGPMGLVSEKNYTAFLTKFKEEIELNGNKNLIELARKDDRYITITFQSTRDSIEIWVMNNQSVTAIEKRQILSKLGMNAAKADSFFNNDDGLVEGAGFGINLILKILRTYSHEKNPLKVIFYPDSLKFGFSLKRSELLENKPEDPAP